ncbi:uncharacterized protein TNCV_3260221 [Trichonephila clavipes]|nr:uncharacterized protein TNCV_3260221 [Trichonephila clavipes]
MLIVFFDAVGIVHHEYAPQGQTVNKEFYLDVMRRLREVVQRKRPVLWAFSRWMLHHAGAPAHTTILVQQFLTKHGTIQVAHLPYSPDMSPPDFFLFPKIKNSLKGHRFQDIETIKQNIRHSRFRPSQSLSSRNVSRTGNIVEPSVLLPMEHISKEIDSKPVYVCMFLHNKFSLDTF